MKLRVALLTVARSLGLFALARRMTSGHLRILCYHGAALRDEHRFKPGLFISGETFERRMRHLADAGYPIVSLEEGVRMLRAGAVAPGATVITIDDGWFGTYKVLAPILQRHAFASTLYIASYYVDKQTQVFNVAAAYVMWAVGKGTIDLKSLGTSREGVYEISDTKQRDTALRELTQYAEQGLDAPGRQELFRKLCRQLGINPAEIERERRIAFMTREEAAQLPNAGMDVQLHTHRHRFPMTGAAALTAEIEDNRAALAKVVQSPLRHLCYPSGEYDAALFPVLEKLGISSATTTTRGLNTPGTPLLELRRILDSDDCPQILFEAEMSGFQELLRKLKGRAHLPAGAPSSDH